MLKSGIVFFFFSLPLFDLVRTRRALDDEDDDENHESYSPLGWMETGKIKNKTVKRFAYALVRLCFKTSRKTPTMALTFNCFQEPFAREMRGTPC